MGRRVRRAGHEVSCAVEGAIRRCQGRAGQIRRSIRDLRIWPPAKERRSEGSLSVFWASGLNRLMFLMKTSPPIDAACRKTTVLSFAAAVCAVAFAAEAADDRVKIDNDQARVLVVTSAPGAKSDLHEHKMNRVMIYLDPGKMTLTDSAGKVETLNFKAGDALWSAATTRPHVSLNAGDKPVRIVEVELKSKPGGPSTAKLGALDWVKVDPKRYKVEIENDQVRVVRAHYGPHEKGVMHEHPWNYVVAFLTDCKLKVTNPEGESRTATREPGDVTSSGPSKHLEENLNDKPLEVVVVEFKK